MENINSWKDIQWSAIEKRIFRLQLRIYRATVNQEFYKVFKLQKLLISSKSAKYLSVRKITEDNKGKQTPGVENKLIESRVEKLALANRLKLDGRSSQIRRISLDYQNGKRRPLEISKLEDGAKQNLAYLALCPQWEAQFESSSYGFRPGRSVLDAIEAIFLGISKNPKWVLDANIRKCFDEINHEYLLDKCNTFPKLRNQIQSWLKAGILDGEEYIFPAMGTPEGGTISPLLANIALHGLRDRLDAHINTLPGHRTNNRQALTYVRYADDFVLMYPDKNTLEDLKRVTEQFLKPIGLKLHSTKIVHTYENTTMPAGFRFLGFDIVQRSKKVSQRVVNRQQESNQKFITLITPSKERVRRHKLKIRQTIRRYRGINQERLIQTLNPIIRGWALLKRTQILSKIFSDLDAYVYLQLWKWARKRHPKMSKVKLKNKYWHIIGKRNWVFGLKEDGEVTLQLQLHSKVHIKRHPKVKDSASPFDGNVVYWAKRTGKSVLISPIKARLIRDQKGRCTICGNFFLPDDIIDRDYIVPKALVGNNLRSNVRAVHRYCHLKKTKSEMLKIRHRKI